MKQFTKIVLQLFTIVALIALLAHGCNSCNDKQENKMSKPAVLISQADAEDLARASEPVFINDTANPDRYMTYPDVASSAGITPLSPPFDVTSENPLTAQLTYNASDGTFPIIRTKRMYPR